jgi:hypothetical protein
MSMPALGTAQKAALERLGLREIDALQREAGSVLVAAAAAQRSRAQTLRFWPKRSCE